MINSDEWIALFDREHEVIRNQLKLKNLKQLIMNREDLKFDLDAARQFNPIMLRNGLPARFVCFDIQTQRVIIAVDGRIESREADGRVYRDTSNIHDDDIVMKPRVDTIYVGLYETADGGHTSHSSKTKANIEDNPPPGWKLLNVFQHEKVIT